MENEDPSEILKQIEHLVEEHFDLKEREAARDLIRDVFHLLPAELQGIYHHVLELHQEGRYEEASELFEVWMERARELGLI